MYSCVGMSDLLVFPNSIWFLHLRLWCCCHSVLDMLHNLHKMSLASVFVCWICNAFWNICCFYLFQRYCYIKCQNLDWILNHMDRPCVWNHFCFRESDVRQPCVCNHFCFQESDGSDTPANRQPRGFDRTLDRYLVSWFLTCFKSKSKRLTVGTVRAAASTVIQNTESCWA